MRKLKRSLLKLLLKTSEPTHDWVIRKLFKVSLPHEENEIIYYKIAESEDEVKQALQLVQESYVDSQITDKYNQVYNVNKFKLSPTTTMFVAKKGDEVIATTSQVMDTSLGLPIEQFTKIDNLRLENKRISEISGLAIKRSYRKSNGQSVYLQLVVYAVLYTKHFLGVQTLVIMTRASAKDFYRALFGFKPIDGKCKPYSGANDTISFAQYMDLENLEINLLSLYGEKTPINKNIYKIIKDNPWKSFCDNSPPKYNIIFNRSFNLKTIEYFFKLQSDVIQTLPSQDLQFFKFMYDDKEYQDLLGESHLKNARSNPRFYSSMKVENSVDNHKKYNVIEISKTGFSILSKEHPNQIYGHIYLNSETPCFISAELIWNNGGKAGYLINSVDEIQWQKLFNWVEQESRNQLSPEESQKKKAA